ncbi:hypothetical protein CLV84_3045 [Neolewinella xylanilytica]|uniref:Tetratricopeptide repeat protein n=1 Tax=Neolewinella xylanilytica TaxID=1514080 RepID=A0A2S6I4L8_9BACT|nr:hypothetical protein [Neolewinella xylanilytica]PPK86126.1 hypothetical protein CLV84_3045 [Neolewinella xylanilytica]
MHVGDYLSVLKDEEEWEELPTEYTLDWFYYPRNGVTERNATYPTRAFSRATPALGRFPVVLYAPSYQASSTENFMLGEYLASHGYLVLAAPSRGARNLRLTGGTSEDAGAQQRDLAYLFGMAAGLPQADPEHVYTIGFSFGGLSNVPFTMVNRFVDGVISLDGTIKYNPSVAAAVPGFDLARFRVPFVHFRQKPIPDTILVADGIDPGLAQRFTFLDSLRDVPAYEFEAPDLTHGQFASYGLLFAPRDERQDRPVERIHLGYAGLCEAVLTTLQYMATYARQQRWDDTVYVAKILETGHRLMNRSTVTSPAAKQGMADFFDHVRQRGYDQIDSVYSDFRRAHRAFAVPEGVLNTVGLQLGLSDDEAKQQAGTAVLDFAVERYPESANLHDSLATVYLHRGLRDRAIYHFERSLMLFPGNENAQRQLRKLEQ